MQKKNCTRIAKAGRTILSVLARPFSMTAFADETNTSDSSPAPVPQAVDIAALLAQARKEEKDKLYPRIEAAEKKVNQAQGLLNDLLGENGSLKTTIATLNKDLADAKAGTGTDDATVQQLRDDLGAAKARIKELEDATPADEATIRAAVEAEYAVKFYRQEKIAESRLLIADALDDEITGATKEEVDASIQKAIKKTKALRKSFGLPEDPTEAGEDSVSSKPAPKPKSKKPPVANPAVSGQNGQMSVEEIYSLDPASPEYAAFRKAAGLI